MNTSIKKLVLGLLSATVLSAAIAGPAYQMQVSAKGVTPTRAPGQPAPAPTPAPTPAPVPTPEPPPPPEPEVLPPMDAAQYVVLTTGSSYALPLNAAKLTTWVIGAGGGGAGSVAVDGTSGGGGAAGGLAYGQMAVPKGTVLQLSFGAPGAGGVGSSAGAKGGDTFVDVNGVTLVGKGGNGGFYNSLTMSAGGGYQGATGVLGGAGGYASGDRGGAGGGAIGAASGGSSTISSGIDGAQAANFNGLAEAIAQAGYTWVGPGKGSGPGSGSTANVNNGAAATGFGNGGGGAGYYGGNGGAGVLGGGGGGAAGYTGIVRGGAGGQGVIVLKIE